MGKSIKKNEYTPWKGDRKIAIVLGLIVAILMALAFVLWKNGSYSESFLTLLAAALVAPFFTRRHQRYKARQFGQEFEKEHRERAVKLLEKSGFECSANQLIRGVGDVDLLVKNDGKPLPVEIKSYQRWGQWFFFMDARSRKAIQQAERQRQALRANWAIVWLPQGRASWIQRLLMFRRGNVEVVIGSEARLLKSIRKLF